MAVKLSIVIPHYNSPDMLDDLLSEAVGYEDTQILVVDDNSTKHLKRLAAVKEKYKEQVTFLRNESGINSPGTTRNYGLDAAVGQWLLFADADDHLEPLWHDTLSPLFSDKDNDIIHFPPISDSRIPGKTCKRFRRFRRLVLNKPDWKGDAYLKYNEIVVWSKLFRRELIETNHIRFDNVLHSDDVMFSVKAGFFARQIGRCRTPIYRYMDTPTSMTKQKGELMFKLQSQVGMDRVAYLKEHLPKRKYNYLCWGGLRDLLVRTYLAVSYRCSFKTWWLYFKQYMSLLKQL